MIVYAFPIIPILIFILIFGLSGTWKMKITMFLNVVTSKKHRNKDVLSIFLKSNPKKNIKSVLIHFLNETIFLHNLHVSTSEVNFTSISKSAPF